MKHKIILTNTEPSLNPSSEELSKVIIDRLGLMPRKKGSTENIHRVLIELYERSKSANQNKQPEKAVMTVEEMAVFAGITRQTMYDYLPRWVGLNLITKTSYINEGKVIIGYKLNGNTLEQAFEKVISRIQENLNFTRSYIQEFQKVLKNEKISDSKKRQEVIRDD